MKRLGRFLSSLSGWVLQPLLVVLILVGGFVAAKQLSLRREPPQRSETATYAPLVRAQVAVFGEHPVEVRGHGTLEARTRIELVPQVGGEVVEIHPGLRTGGAFAAGDVLLRIEPRDYELAVARAEADVAAAETGVVRVRAESESAVAEWQRRHADEPCPALVRLEPQLREAAAKVLSAEVELDRARLDLERTQVALPFAGRVRAAGVDVGQVVARNQVLGSVYATSVFEVAVPLRVEELRWLQLPEGGTAVGGSGSPAVVRGPGRAGPVEVRGRIARLHGELDPTSRLAYVVVEIAADELELGEAERLLPGTFVDVEFEAGRLSGVSAVPRGAVREDGVLWILDGDVLRFARPTLLHQGEGTVLVEGLEPGVRVVTSNLEVVTDGMQVRVEGAGR